MNDLNKLGKLSETIGKIYFTLILILLLIFGTVLQLNLWETKHHNIIILIISCITSYLIYYYITRLLFKPIYGLNNNIKNKIDNKFSERQFKHKWWTSLFCTLFIAILPIIPTFGVSILIMVPQFILLSKSKRL